MHEVAPAIGQLTGSEATSRRPGRRLLDIGPVEIDPANLSEGKGRGGCAAGVWHDEIGGDISLD
jgi:hypothetical protein